MRALRLSACFLTALVSGCGAAGVYENGSRGVPYASDVDSAKDKDKGPTGRGALAATAEQLQRKIIYNLGLDVIVADFSPVPAKIEAAVRQSPQAYISGAAVTGTAGSHRQGDWTIRVPQDQYDGLVETLRGLGEVMREQKTSQEVTEEFYDLQSRLNNKQETEKRLLKLQQDRTGDLKDIVAVEEQIDRVREEIERMQGRLARLENLSSLVTITLRVVEMRDYRPEQTIAFGERASSTFQSSFAGLALFGQNLALFAVALAPWLPLLVLLALAIRALVRRYRRSHAPAVRQSPPAVPA
jgi:hypothetical protein